MQSSITQWSGRETYPGSAVLAWLAGVGGGTAIALPTVTTGPVTGMTGTAATGHGTIVSDGGGAISECGVCWGASPNPTTSGSKAVSSATAGAFAVTVSTLTAHAVYHVRAYAINEKGTSYGDDVTFTSTSSGQSPRPSRHRKRNRIDSIK